MFNNFFKKNKTRNEKEMLEGGNQPIPTQQSSYDPATESLLRAIAEKKKEDPLIGLKIGAKEITTQFTKAFKNDKGIHIESYLTALSAITGFSCQMALRQEVIKSGKGTEKEVFMTITDSNGDNYFFGDNLNKPLAENKYSVWSIIAAGIQDSGGTLPDIQDMFSHSIKTIGSANFAKPRVPEKHQATTDTPQNYIKHLWPVTLPILNMFCDRPMEWPVMLSFSLQNMLIQAKTVIPPEIAGTIVMETALAMSKINPKSVGIE